MEFECFCCDYQLGKIIQRQDTAYRRNRETEIRLYCCHCAKADSYKSDCYKSIRKIELRILVNKATEIKKIYWQLF